MRAPSLATALAASSLLAGCAVGPDYHSPGLAAPATFMGSAAVAARDAAPAPATDARWWSRFGDPILSELVDKALSQNLDIAQTVARVTQARAGLNAASAALLPSGTVTGSAAAVKLSQDTLQGRELTAFGTGRNTENYEADLGASWEIDLFGGLRRDREAARDEYQASRAGVAAARLSVAAQVADTYIAIRGLQERLTVADEQVATQQRLVDTIGLQYRRGIAAELQLRQSEGVLAQVRGTVPVLQVALDDALNALDVLMGEQPGTERERLSTPSAIPAAPAIADIGSPADLLQRRPDLIVAERKLAASNARIGSAISEYYPRFSLSGLIGTATTGPASLLTGGAGGVRAALAAVRLRPRRRRDQERARPQRRGAGGLPPVCAACVRGRRGRVLGAGQPRAAAAHAGGRRQSAYSRPAILNGSLQGRSRQPDRGARRRHAPA